MHRIRLGVTENRLSDPAKVTEASFLPFIAAETAWVAESGRVVASFAALDAPQRSVWALFVAPTHEGQGIGRALHDLLLGEARQRGASYLELTTQPGSRAERLYSAAGWRKLGAEANGDVRLAISLPATTSS